MSYLRICHGNHLSNIKTDLTVIVIEYSFLTLQMVAGINAEKTCTIPHILANGLQTIHTLKGGELGYFWMSFRLYLLGYYNFLKISQKFGQKISETMVK